MKNKAFTLVELLAVITVMGLIGLITIPIVDSIISDSEEKARKAQLKELEGIAKGWLASNIEKLDEEEGFCITINELLKTGYIENDEVIDPTTDESFIGGFYVTYSEKYQNYQLEYQEECK